LNSEDTVNLFLGMLERNFPHFAPFVLRCRSIRCLACASLLLNKNSLTLPLSRLGRPDLDNSVRLQYTDILSKRTAHLFAKEADILQMETNLGSHESVLSYADAACLELTQRIQDFERKQDQGDHTFTLRDFQFPQVSALASLTDSNAYHAHRRTPEQNNFQAKSSFTLFLKLPPEIRIMIWRSCLPPPRLITYGSQHNKALSLLGVCRESRQFMEGKLSKILSPGLDFPKRPIPSIYVNLETDTVIRDLTAHCDSGLLFDLEITAFNLRCSVLLSGLTQVRHLALGFDLLHDNGGELFGPLQACCPSLQTLTIFPGSQLSGASIRKDLPLATRVIPCPPLPSDRFQLLEFDNNFLDYLSFRFSLLSDRTIKSKARRGLNALMDLAGHKMQYANVFPNYVAQYGQSWKPVIKVCMMVRWDGKMKGWRTGYMESDRYTRGFLGDDGQLYPGWVESAVICDEEGEVMSRYEGVRELFGDIDRI
jgi:hypothetical protein